MTSNDSASARDILAFYVEAGVDIALNEVTTDWLASADPSPERESETGREELTFPARPQAPPATAAAIRAAATALPSPDTAVMAAREAARSAESLAALRAILDGFQGCALRTGAKTLVFADGDPASAIMFVGEAPGQEEDLAGLPFVGRSGQLLDRMMAAIGLDRSSAYIGNIIPWRPPGNRTPTPQESQICLPFILRQIELADPDILVCLGGRAAQAVLGVSDGIMKTRGRWFNFNTGRRDIRAIATLHPAYLLRQPLAKRLAWRDFLTIKRALAEHGARQKGK